MHQRDEKPFLLILGGPPGAGKTTLSHRLTAQLHIPRLGADTISRTIRASQAYTDQTINTKWLAYDVLFQLCNQFLKAEVSTIVDVNLAGAFQWRELDLLQQRYPLVEIVPVVLVCPREICLERICQRYRDNPTYYDPPEYFLTKPTVQKAWAFLDQLDRPDAYLIDAARSKDDVYTDTMHYLAERLESGKRRT